MRLLHVFYPLWFQTTAAKQYQPLSGIYLEHSKAGLKIHFGVFVLLPYAISIIKKKEFTIILEVYDMHFKIIVFYMNKS